MTEETSNELYLCLNRLSLSQLGQTVLEVLTKSDQAKAPQADLAVTNSRPTAILSEHMALSCKPTSPWVGPGKVHALSGI